MHGKSSTTNETRMGRSGTIGNRNASNGTCQCGCGAILDENKWGHQRRFVLGHQCNKRSRDEWEKRWIAAKQLLPLCQCGCGEQVELAAGKNLDAFIRSRGTTRYHRYKQSHDKRPESWNLKLSEQESQAILGTLLGDSSIGFPNSRSTNARIACNHGKPQEGWARHKAAFLSRLGTRVSECECGGFGTTTVRYITKCLPAITQLHGIVYENGEKQITTKWLDGIGGVGLAWWLCDDGSPHGTGSFTLHTEGYSSDAIECAVNWFGRKYGPVSIGRGRTRGWILQLKRECRNAIRDVVAPYIPECMAYKRRVFDKDRSIDRRRGSV